MTKKVEAKPKFICVVPLRSNGVGHLARVGGEKSGQLLCGGKFNYTWANHEFNPLMDCIRCEDKRVGELGGDGDER